MNKVKSLIDVVKLPLKEVNNYFEYSSADGFALLGAARLLIGLSYDKYIKEIQNRNMTLNEQYRCGKYKVLCPKETRYIYTLWTCVELLKNIKDLKNTKEIIDKIGIYNTGFQRYCDTEIFYQVPNVTSAAALIYNILGDKEKSNKFIKLLEDTQVNGNWFYKDIKTDKNYKHQEDQFHVAMMIYHIRQCSINTKMIDKSLYCLNKQCIKTMEQDPVGWGPPMIYMASHGLDNKLAQKALDITITKTINATNFRARAFAAWALANAYINGDV